MKEYFRLRAKGWTPSNAFRAARIKERFEDLESRYLVRFEVESDDEPYDASYIDTWDDVSETKREAYRKAITRRVDSEGVSTIVAYVRATADDPWIMADSCGGFIGEDWRDSGYDVDVKATAIDSFDGATSNAAATYETSRATYAA